MNVPFANDSEFLEAVALLVDLQFAICEDNEEWADALRDALDTPLSKLSWEANEWLRGLSGDLDMLCDQEVFEPNELSTTDYKRDLTAAWQNIESNPAAILTLLRKEQQFLPPDAIAYFRGYAYHLLNLYAIEVFFLRRAVELNPECVPYKVSLLDSLWSGGDLAQARPLAEAILEDKTANLENTLLTAGFMLRIIKKVSPDDREALGRLRRKVGGAIHSMPMPATAPNLVGFGFMLLGEISETLNRTTQAEENYSRACDLMPDDGTPFLLRGRLMFKKDERKALPDFRYAVNLGTSDPLPYLVVARESLRNKDYADCHVMCLSAIGVGGPMVQGQAYELMAIAEAQTHGETELIQHYFDEALRPFPSNGNIQRNRAMFEQARRELLEQKAPTQKDVAEYQFDRQEGNKAVQNDPFDLLLQAKSSKLWLGSNLIKRAVGHGGLVGPHTL